MREDILRSKLQADASRAKHECIEAATPAGVPQIIARCCRTYIIQNSNSVRSCECSELARAGQWAPRAVPRITSGALASQKRKAQTLALARRLVAIEVHTGVRSFAATGWHACFTLTCSASSPLLWRSCSTSRFCTWIFLSGFTAFGVASLESAMSPTEALLVSCRVSQAGGSSLMIDHVNSSRTAHPNNIAGPISVN